MNYERMLTRNDYSSGDATYYYQYGVAGSCGTVHSVSIQMALEISS